MEIYSKIDSERFGIKVGKVTEQNFNNVGVVDNIINYFDDNYDLILAKINVDNIKLINELEKYNFRIKDVQSTLYYKINNYCDTRIGEKSFNIREFNSKDTDILVELGIQSFDNYGHYFSDERLDNKDCLAVYGDWVYNCCINKEVADKIFVAEENGEIIGFLSFKTKLLENKKYAAGVIGAVSLKHRNKGVFQDIVRRGLVWGQENDYQWEEHNVLINNFPVNKSFLNLGFKPNNTFTTLHCWIDELKSRNYVI